MNISGIQRGFAQIKEGQVHFRHAGKQNNTNQIPLVMIHASPGSAKSLEPLITLLAVNRWVIALDTLGNGDSCAPVSTEISMAYLANAHCQALDDLGVKEFNLYGTHTGANIAVEISISQTIRVQKLILDGVSLYSIEQRKEFLEQYSPDIVLDQNGSQFLYMWNFIRDAYLFWPWYQKSKNYLRNTGLPSAEALHDKAVEVFKAARTYPAVYRAAIAYDKTNRLPLVKTKTLLACSKTDMLYENFEAVSKLLPFAKKLTYEGSNNYEELKLSVSHFENFLSST